MCRRTAPLRSSNSLLIMEPRREPATVERSWGRRRSPKLQVWLSNTPKGGPRADCWACAASGWLELVTAGWLAARATSAAKEWSVLQNGWDAAVNRGQLPPVGP
ncbi:hypothetical protein NDU88_004935 [Pleurodeles waltl]|uniref:Uncharacterized protein n=1 Tax=Pleurodeles waltl TaxID=8319 RepID=A0AAV7MXS5_PLEWA|nr:hypothetical protein NDU88_004935 [Pleurodeles waltl]